MLSSLIFFFLFLCFPLLCLGAPSRAGPIGTDSVAHSGDYSGGTCSAYVVRHAVSSSRNYSGPNRYNTLEKRSAGLWHEQSEVRTVSQISLEFSELKAAVI